MADRLFSTSWNFQGGFATDLARQVRQLNYLKKAENALYEVSGAVRKVGGSARVNVTAITGTPDVVGGYDFWLSGVGGSFTQKFVVVTGNGKVLKEDMDGVYDDITGTATIAADAVPVFATFTDLLTIWFSTNNTPLKWNQTGNVASLGGSPPTARTAAVHVGRLWAAGANATPSRLFFAGLGNAEDWTGADTGSIDVDPEDGDRIIGLASHKGRLLVFKGPNKGSIHQISGNTVATFSRTVLVTGIPLQSSNAIVPVGDDIWFMSDRGVHSISATERFGDFGVSDITRFLRGFFMNQLSRGRLDRVWGVNYAHKQCALWTLTRTGRVENDMAFGISYIRLPEEGPKPFTWLRECLCAAIRDNPASRIREVVFGSTDGFVLRQDVAARNLEGTDAYTFTIETPAIIIAPNDAQGKAVVDQPVQLYRMFMRSRPSTVATDITVSVARDNESSETYTFSQQGSGFILGTDRLGTGRLGGEDVRTVSADLVGEARTIRMTITQGTLNQDANIEEIGVYWKPVAQSGAAALA